LCLLAFVIPAAPAAANTVILPFIEVSGTAAQGHATFDIAAGAINTATETYASTELQPASQAAYSLTSNADDLFDPNGRRSKFFVLQPLLDNAGAGQAFPPRMLIAELLAGTSAGVTLYVGADANRDGVPQANEVICQAQASESAPARCLIGPEQLAGQIDGQTYWVLAAAPPGNLDLNFTAFVSAGLPDVVLPTGANPQPLTSLSGGRTVVTGPGHAAANAAFPLRLTWEVGPVPSQQRYYGALLAGTGPVASLVDNASAALPFALVKTITSNDISRPMLVDPVAGDLSNFVASRPPPAYVTLQPHEVLQRLFFDLPPATSAYESIRITTLGVAPDDIGFQAVRSDFPPASPDALVDPAPADVPPSLTWNLQDSPAVLPHPASGRWYIVATNKTDRKAAFTLIFDSLTGIGSASGDHPTIAAGQYFNARRAGHGISISQAFGQQLLLWYTYLEDGTPTWYIAQAVAPPANSGWWTSPLYRVAWNGSGGTPIAVGHVELTPTSTNRFMFSWYLEGEEGSEAFDLLVPTASCPLVNGATTNLAGNWFAPAQSGYGVDVIALPGQQSDIFYFYDSLGLARWGIGSAPFAQSSTLTMLQSSGFCPGCAWTAVTTQPLGTLTMNFADAMIGSFAADFQLKPPLDGAWSIDQTMLRLTGSAACIP
jgi:hypothetical protein